MSAPSAKRFSLKLMAEYRPEGMPRAVVPVFHRWIRDGLFAEIVPVDVADYSHVHHGPGVLLVGHHADIGLGEVGGALGLTYIDKRSDEPDVPSRLAVALERLRAAVRELEGETPLRFRHGGVELQVLDRLHEGNEEALEEALRGLPIARS